VRRRLPDVIPGCWAAIGGVGRYRLKIRRVVGYRRAVTPERRPNRCGISVAPPTIRTTGSPRGSSTRAA
jgi:hypothetical protein